MNENWTLPEVWNAATLAREDRPIVPRDYMYASELGKGIADVVLKMRGEEPSNPPNARSIRKFEAGDVYEWIVRLVLMRAGILHTSQEALKTQIEGMVPVSGRLDFVAGGHPKYEEALAEVDALHLPPLLGRTGRAVVEYLAAKYPEGMEPTIIEVKSQSVFVFDAMERTGKASRNHRLQLLHYMKAKGYASGKLVYICRDDLRLREVEIFADDGMEEEYRKEVAEVSRVYQSGEMVPLEASIVYDEDTEKFSKNWQVAYSSYLTKLYGFKDQAEFDEMYVPMATAWNSALKRRRSALARARWLADVGATEEMVQKEKGEGKKTATIQFVEVNGDKRYVPLYLANAHTMTPKNLEAKNQMAEQGFDLDELAARMKDAGPEEEGEEVTGADV